MRNSIPLSLPALMLASPAAAHSEDWGYHWHNFGDWAVGLLGFLVTILFWAAIITLVVLAVRRYGGNIARSAAGSSPALEVLRDRFARGEIDLEDFETRRKALQDQP